MASLYRLASTAQYVRFPTTAAASAFPKYFSARKSIKPTLPAGKTASAAAAAAIGLSFGANSSGHRPLGYANLNTCQLHSKSSYRHQQQQTRNFSSLQIPLQSQHTKLVQHNAMAPLKNGRYISSKEITKNITLYTAGEFKNVVDKNTLEIKKPTGNPLVLMMAWMMAKQKHLRKYAEIYTQIGFDVMVVHVTPWQLLWPVKGTQIVAAETLKFLESNRSYAPIVLHGFSVGAYQFGEVMLQMARDMDRYAPILDRFACQVWDSAADITEIPVGLPKSIFPKNQRMQSALRNYTLYHMKTFHNQATIHYMRSSQMFHSTLLKKPAIFFVSDNDPIGPPSSNQAVREDWERVGIQCTFKRWEHSMHTGHYIKHREEYLDLLFKHLEATGVLEAIGVKSRAKL